MSVPKSLRSEGKLRVITLANELAAYTMRICSNEKNFPKRYRWCITSKIVDDTIEICKCVNIANSIFVSTEDDYKLRRQYQTKGLSLTYSLLTLVDIAYKLFSIEGGKIEFWTAKIYELQVCIRNWRNSDKTRFS